MATIHDVANAAGVSTATVSRVLNGSNLVSSKKKKLVMDAITSTGYIVPERVVRTTTSAKKLIILIGSLYHPPICNNFQKEIIDLGYQVLFCYYDNPQYLSSIRNTLQLLKNQIAGIMLLNTPDDSRELQELLADYPLVQIGSSIYADAPNYTIGSDEVSVSRTAMDYLIEQGCRKTAVISFDSKSSILMARNNNRVNGCLLSQLNHRMSVDYSLIKYVDATFEGGYDGIRDLLVEHPDIDSVVCTLDSIGVGCNYYLNQEGLRSRIRMIIADSSETWDLHKLGIPFINNHQESIGASAARILHAVIVGELSTPFQQYIPFELDC
ncbi:MAG: LacI family DNA-binding transcriptional regulator [Eubacteriales bacterium]|nr:LacI family DNA-binding transcriptional regulator [Eubacteriales bacterium]